MSVASPVIAAFVCLLSLSLLLTWFEAFIGMRLSEILQLLQLFVLKNLLWQYSLLYRLTKGLLELQWQFVFL